jgi:hypothetical protein
MSENAPEAANDGLKRRRPYSPPRILSREPLEAMAAVCLPRGVAKANVGTCPRGPINS